MVCSASGLADHVSRRGIPTVVIGIVTFFVLTDKPEQAKFLTQEEKDWLVAKLAAERKAKEVVRTFRCWKR